MQVASSKELVLSPVYINPELNQFWPIDYRIYSPDDDGKTKLNHVSEMLSNAIIKKNLSVRTVLMDTWYAERKLMMQIERLGLFYYCPLKSNRFVDESDGQNPYLRIDALDWEEHPVHEVKIVHIKAFPKGHRGRLFRLALSSVRTEYVVANDISQDDGQVTQQVCALCWKIEQLYRELKQLTSLEDCQCRKARIQRNHFACAFFVWARLKAVAQSTKQTLYQVKRGLLDDYMRQELRSPSVKMRFA